jgi:serine/threonine-protein kinase RsbW
MPEIQLPARIEHLEPLMAFVSDCAEAQGFSGKRVQEIQLATEEALVNIFHYAYPEDGVGDVRILCRSGADNTLVVEFRDTGIPFEFENLGTPDVEASVDGREIGGLGIFLIRKMVDEVHYRREEGENVLTFTLQARE